MSDCIFFFFWGGGTIGIFYSTIVIRIRYTRITLSVYLMADVHYRARTRLGSKLYVISAFCPRQDADKCRNHCSHCIDCRECPRNQSGRDKDSERNLSGICGEVCGMIMRIFKIGFCVLSASCPRPYSGRAVLSVTDDFRYNYCYASAP